MRFFRTASFCLALALFGLAAPAWSQTKAHAGWFSAARKALPAATQKHGRLIHEAARAYDVPPDLLLGVMMVESLGNEHVRGGLMQASRAAQLATGIRCPLHQPTCQARVSAAYLRQLREQSPSWDHALVAYNRGPHAVRGIDPARNAYVLRVMYIRELDS